MRWRATGFGSRFFGFQVSGLNLSGFGFGSRFFGCRVSGFRFRISCFGFRISGFGFRVSGFGFRVSDFGFRVSGFGYPAKVSYVYVEMYIGCSVNIPGFSARPPSRSPGQRPPPPGSSAPATPRSLPKEQTREETHCPRVLLYRGHSKSGTRGPTVGLVLGQ